MSSRRDRSPERSQVVSSGITPRGAVHAKKASETGVAHRALGLPCQATECIEKPRNNRAAGWPTVSVIDNKRGNRDVPVESDEPCVRRQESARAVLRGSPLRVRSGRKSLVCRGAGGGDVGHHLSQVRGKRRAQRMRRSSVICRTDEQRRTTPILNNASNPISHRTRCSSARDERERRHR